MQNRRAWGTQESGILIGLRRLAIIARPRGFLDNERGAN
jgi:hypothetical protein